MFKHFMFSIALFSVVPSVFATSSEKTVTYEDFKKDCKQAAKRTGESVKGYVESAAQVHQKSTVFKADDVFKAEEDMSLNNYFDSNAYVANKYNSFKTAVFAFLASGAVHTGFDCPWGTGYGSKATPVQEASWYNKVLDAEVAGYKGAGKYVIAGTAVAVTAVVAAYYAGLFGKKATTLESQIEALILQAQTNPNLIIVELPKILAACDNDQVRFEIFNFVLSNVEITPEIQQAFEL